MDWRREVCPVCGGTDAMVYSDAGDVVSRVWHAASATTDRIGVCAFCAGHGEVEVRPTGTLRTVITDSRMVVGALLEDGD